MSNQEVYLAGLSNIICHHGFYLFICLAVNRLMEDTYSEDTLGPNPLLFLFGIYYAYTGSCLSKKVDHGVMENSTFILYFFPCTAFVKLMTRHWDS